MRKPIRRAIPGGDNHRKSSKRLAKAKSRMSWWSRWKRHYPERKWYDPCPNNGGNSFGQLLLRTFRGDLHFWKCVRPPIRLSVQPFCLSRCHGFKRMCPSFRPSVRQFFPPYHSFPIILCLSSFDSVHRSSFTFFYFFLTILSIFVLFFFFISFFSFLSFLL